MLLIHACGDAIGLGILGFPGVEVFCAGGEGAVVGLETAGADQQEVGVK